MFNPKRNKLAIILGAAFLLIVSSAILIASGNCRQERELKGNQKNAVMDSAMSEGGVKCPLDGSVVSDLPNYRPLAVVIDDLPEARPQSGLNSADIVFEALAEGGVTRLLAVFYHGEAPRVGPVRSARPYFIHLAEGLKAVLVHSGGSPDALSYMKSHDISHIDEFRFSLGFWRSDIRKAPHNLYSDTSRLHRLIQENGLNENVVVPGLASFSDPEDFCPEEGELRSHRVEVFFSKDDPVIYIFDTGEQVYRRFVKGKSHLDANSNKQISPRNIIVQFVKTKVVDMEGRLEMEVVGQGRALIFTAGTVTEATWQKTAVREATTYKTVDGKNPELLPGQTWIEIVPSNTKVTF